MILLRPSLRRLAPPRDPSLVCSQCLWRVNRSSPPSAIRSFISFSRLQSSIVDNTSTPSRLNKSYFSPNKRPDGLVKRNGFFSPLRTVNSSTQANPADFASSSKNESDASPIGSEPSQTELPHRRRKRLKEENDQKNGSATTLPPDASAQLSSLSSALPSTSLRRKMAAYLALCKPRLSFLILLTTTSAYGMYPISYLLALDPAMTPLPTLSTSTLTFLYLTTGTFLSCCSANTLNMILEPKYDALMTRTRNRPLVRGLVSRGGAILFAIATAASGLGLLYFGTNPTVTALSAANICLYAFVYTPMKRLHVANTWVGAIVGGIPPLMGWVAAAGQTATTGHDTWRDMLFSENSIGGWLLGAVLFAWQFPHFNALSHLIRDDYKNAGYRMLCWVNPAMNARVALRYSVLMFPISIGLWWVGVVGHGFLVGSTFANGWLVKEAYGFWRHKGSNGTARGLFWASIWQLPILLVGGLVTKKGLWDGVWKNAFGSSEEEDDDYVYYDEEEGDKIVDQSSPAVEASRPNASTA